MKEAGLVSSIREMFATNLNNKGMALTLAVLIWLFAFNNTKGEERRSVRLNFSAADPTQVIVVKRTVTDSEISSEVDQPFTGEVKLTLSGQKSQLRKLDERAWGTLIYTVSASEDVNLRNSEIYELPSGVEVVFASPRAVRVEVNPRVEMIREVVVYPFGNPGPGLTLPGSENITFHPKKWTVLGPSEQVLEFEEIRIDVSFTEVLDETLEVTMPFPELPALVSYAGHLRGDPPTVTITATLGRDHEDREVEVPVKFAFFEGPRTMVSYKPRIKLVLTGAPQELDAFEARIAAGEQWAIVLPKDDMEYKDATGIIDESSLRFTPGLPRTVRVAKVAGTDQAYNYDLEYQ